MQLPPIYGKMLFYFEDNPAPHDSITFKFHRISNKAPHP